MALQEETAATELGEEVKSETRRFRFTTFASLRHRNFAYLWSGTLLMGAGQWIQQVTLGWLMYDLTGSSILLGVLNGARSIPFLVAGPIAGVVADRVDRRKLLLLAEQFLFATALIMGWLAVTESVAPWHLFVFTLATGVAWSFSDPVRQSLIPNVVPKQDLVNAVALNSVANNAMKVIGPSFGGFFIALFSAGANFFVQAVAYAGVLSLIYRMEVPRTPARARQSSMLANLKEGLRYVWTNRLVLALILSALVPRLLAVPYQTLMPVFQKDVLRVGPAGLGMLMAAPGIGGLLALLTLASIAGRVRRQGLLMLAAVTLLGLFLVVFSQTKSFRLALLLLVGVGSCQVMFNATVNTLLHLTVPDELRGRVMSTYMLDRGLMPAGALLAGTSAHFIGAPATTGLMGSAVLLLGIYLALRVPVIRRVQV
ncbi:MAG TPA: MFS transporter [Candidatus Acidoferrales bacterium]|nr:MFS transporter [Candidatus Acidoferrales bacterium]